MIWASVALTSLFGLVAVALLVVLLRRRPSDRLLPALVLERFVTTIASGESFDALLASVDDRSVVLREATVLSTDGKRTPVTGDLVLRRESISYMQRP
jgi:hypothetical protein